ncbi:putative NADH-flavin reductase [Streptomyces sp. MP131-18]|nr:putative NADH-flavin reductase [Streptomyces sp. MP131-18]
MRILITGGSGRVGGHVARQLAENHQVTATGRSLKPQNSDQATWRQADLADPEPWPSLLGGVDAAFLFPAFGHTQHFIDAAAQAGLRKLSATPEAFRHGVSAADIAVSKPALRTVPTSGAPPACETTVRSPPSMRTRGYGPIRFFTRKALLSVQSTGPWTSPIVASQKPSVLI